MIKIALVLFIVFMAITALFQLALAMGAPWGKIAMAGKYPGKFPNKMRIVAVFQMFILLFFIWIALVKTGHVNPEWKNFSDSFIWAVFGFSLVATILNTITPSKWERIIWMPISIILLVSSTIIAMN
jgi:hypothetical protein